MSEEELERLKLKTMAQIVQGARQSGDQIYLYLAFCTRIMFLTGCTQQYLDAKINEYLNY